MGKQSFNEALLHWVWEKQQFKGRMETTEGKEVAIYHPGRLNSSDGPDFMNANVKIGALSWYGDVEIHWTADDWVRHGHHKNKNYNKVILHVIYEDSEKKVQKPALPTLVIKPFLSKPLADLFEGFKNKRGLPCSQKLSAISPAALEAQIAKAHKQYFGQKVDKLLQWYDPALIPSNAWKKMLVVAMFDGLGIAHNRAPMRKLANALYTKFQHIASLEDLKKEAFDEAFDNAEYPWKRKGSRPANHPEVRIEQGCELFWNIQETSFKEWFRHDIRYGFNHCTNTENSKTALGKSRSGVLYGVVWLPVLYLLGDFFGSPKLASSARQAWMDHRTSLPLSVLRAYREAGVPEVVYRQKLGAVHHYKRYCLERQCHHCEVFKSLISA